MRTPWEFVIASARLFGHAPDDPGPSLSALAMLGQPLWQPPGPNGFSDNSAAWASPEGLEIRLDLAAQWGNRLREPPDPRECSTPLSAPPPRRKPGQTVARAETRQRASLLLLMAPEAQRR